MRRSREDWLGLLAAQAESGLSVADFCRQHQITPSNFYAQRQRLGDASSGFVPLTLPKPAPALSLQGAFGTLHLPAGVDSQWLVQLLRGLS